jgi:hypothetical protein
MKNNLNDRMSRYLDRAAMRKVRESAGSWPVVPYQTTRCPSCGSADVKITRSEPMTEAVTHRRHTCKKCRAKFTSMQEVPRIDRKLPEPPAPAPREPDGDGDGAGGEGGDGSEGGADIEPVV